VARLAEKTTSSENQPAVSNTVISFNDVAKEYDKGIPAVNHINFQIERGEFVFIVGESGSGKSTLIKLMLREIKPTKGKIIINGRDLNKLKKWQIAKYRRKIGVVFQNYRLLTDRTVYENVAFAQRVIEASPEQIKKATPRMLAQVGLSAKTKSFPGELSGGEQQRVAIARALINNPVILLADEPTGNLDQKNTDEIMNLLLDINKHGTTVIIVTHDHEMVKRLKKRVITVRNGFIVSDHKAADGKAPDLDDIEEEIRREAEEEDNKSGDEMAIDYIDVFDTNDYDE
jgi:cell division transport system ATP-binding protein